MRFARDPAAALRLDLQQAGNLHGAAQEDGIKHFLPVVLWRLTALGQSAHQIGEAKHLVEVSPTGADSRRAVFLLFEKPLQIHVADGSGGCIETVAQLNLFAHLGGQRTSLPRNSRRVRGAI